MSGYGHEMIVDETPDVGMRAIVTGGCGSLGSDVAIMLGQLVYVVAACHAVDEELRRRTSPMITVDFDDEEASGDGESFSGEGRMESDHDADDESAAEVDWEKGHCLKRGSKLSKFFAR